MSLLTNSRAWAPTLGVLLFASLPDAQIGTLTTVTGTVSDLAVDSSGDLLYCTLEGRVGTISTLGVVSELANAASGPFTKSLRGVLENGAGEIAVLDESGDIYELTGGLTPANLIYDDLYLITKTTDFVVDANGNYVIASQTPSSGVRGTNWVNAAGDRWAYFLIKHSPIALAADPVGNGLLMSNDAGAGSLLRIDGADASHPSVLLDGTTAPGFTENNLDGDIAVESDGSAWMIAGGNVYRHDRGTNVTSLMASGLAQLRGISIAASSGGVPSASGWSVYLSEGSFPTSIREIGNVGAPASTQAGDLGVVPNRGIQQLFFSGQTVYDMAVDKNGDLLVGGDLFGASFRVLRVSLPSLTLSTVATQASGLTARIEGIQVDADGVIYALGSNGKIHRIEEDPLQVTVVFDDPFNDILVGKDMALDRDGSFFVADRANWGVGQIERIDPNLNLTSISNTVESRGVAADPFTGEILASEWNGTGFEGSIGLVDTDSGAIVNVPGLVGMNYTNASSWGDGDLVQDVRGNIYTISEDDWSLYRYDRNTQKRYRIGSSYLNHPSGLAIARSTSPVFPQTGWSLYVAEFNFLYEIPNVPAPAPRILDRNAPPVGPVVGFLRGTDGAARSMTVGRTDASLLITTSTSQLLKMTVATGFTIQVAGTAQGLSGDLVSISASSTKDFLVANRSGTIFAIDALDGFSVSVFFDNAGGVLSDIRTIKHDGNDDLLILDQPAGEVGGRLYRLSGGVLSLLAITNRGTGMAIDPLSGDVFVTERGSAIDGGGEILRVDTFQSPATAGHFSGDEFFLFDLTDLDGDIAFDDVGNFYVSTGRTGRVTRIDRVTGARSVIAGNYSGQAALALNTGRVGTTGPLGTSIFVLDEWSVFEVAIDELPAPAPPASAPGLAAPASLVVEGQVGPGLLTPIIIDAPAEADRIYAIFPSVTGKVPGVPLGVFGDLSDLRVIPNNYSSLWLKIDKPAVFPGFIGVLDATGKSPANLGLNLPNDPTLLNLDIFMDLAWITFDFVSPNDIATIGGTAQIYIGE
ncbi:MAG: hypothetical protein ACI8TQ_003435 [Planctomycetota bacterium]|jgi:hypothetical protein